MRGGRSHARGCPPGDSVDVCYVGLVRVAIFAPRSTTALECLSQGACCSVKCSIQRTSIVSEVPDMRVDFTPSLYRRFKATSFARAEAPFHGRRGVDPDRPPRDQYVDLHSM